MESRYYYLVQLVASTLFELSPDAGKIGPIISQQGVEQQTERKQMRIILFCV